MSAHHSRSVYDLEQEVTFEGVVTKYEWINPHVYVYVEAQVDAGGRIVWEIEDSPKDRKFYRVVEV